MKLLEEGTGFDSKLVRLKVQLRGVGCPPL